MSPDPEPDPTFLIIYIIVLFVLLVLSAFFSLSETAYTSSNLIKLENQSKNSKAVKLALKITNDYDKFLSTILIGNNLVNIAATSMATILFIKYYGENLGPTLATIAVTIVVLIFGEVAPKSIGREYPETFARINAFPLYFFYILFYPISLLLGVIQKALKSIKPRSEKSKQLTEEELSMLVEDLNEDGVLNDIEEDIIQNTIEYGDCKVQEVMTKAKDIHFVKISDSIETIKQKFADSNYSRLVVTKTNSIQSAFGVIHQKDLFEFLVDKETDINKIIIKNPIETKPTNKVSRLLKKMQSERQHLAIVRDDKKVVGIVTMEDILEELVGEIEDENDE